MSNPNDQAAGRVPDGGIGSGTEPGAHAGSGPHAARPLRAEPEGRAPTAWREPPWFPPGRERPHRERRPHLASIVVGLALVLIGVYFFLDETLGIPMPPIAWGSLWPVLLILVGGLILLRSTGRGD